MSHESRLSQLLREAEQDTLQFLAEQEKVGLAVRGRIPCDKETPMSRVPGLTARLASYDREEKIVTIRLDDYTNLPFWCEVDLPLARLEQFIKEEKESELYANLAHIACENVIELTED